MQSTKKIESYYHLIEITSGGTLTVSDSKSNGSISIERRDLYGIHISSGSSFTLNNATITSNVAISTIVILNGGTFTINGGTIDSGSGHAIYNYGTVYANGGTVSSSSTSEGNSAVQNHGKLYVESSKTGTIFRCTFATCSGDTTNGGIFEGDVENYGKINDGAFYSEVKNYTVISGGTFNGNVTNAANYPDGYGGTVECQSIITDGTFTGTVTNNGSITGGTFDGTIKNNGIIYATANVTGSITYDDTAGNVITYKIGENKYAEQFVKTNYAASQPTVPTKDGYIFGGWYTDAECTVPFDFEATAITEDITLYANFREPTHTVTFSTAHGSIDSATATVDDNGTVAEPTAPTASGYTFGGWYTDESFTTEYAFTTPVTSDLTLYAKWTDIVAPVITGIEDGKIYCEAQTVTVTDENIDTVTVNGTAVTLDANNQFVLSPANSEQTIVAADKDGNKTTMTVTVNDSHTPSDWITDNAATTTEAGSQHKECTVCGKVLENGAVAKLATTQAEKTESKNKSATTDEAKSPQTADNSTPALWLALFIVSGGTITATTLASKKRKHSK
jgi:uncharacterized repeat protein (TIGR02543 family)